MNGYCRCILQLEKVLTAARTNDVKMGWAIYEVQHDTAQCPVGMDTPVSFSRLEAIKKIYTGAYTTTKPPTTKRHIG